MQIGQLQIPRERNLDLPSMRDQRKSEREKSGAC